MAVTTSHSFTGDGSQDTFAFTFPYIDKSEVKATVAGVAVSSSNLTISGSNATISPVPANGAAVVVYRETDTDTARVSWASATELDATDLDTTLKQPLYAIQEQVNDIATNTSGLATEITDRAAADTSEASTRAAADTALDTRVTALEASTNLAVGHVEILNIRHTSGVHSNSWGSVADSTRRKVPFGCITSWTIQGSGAGSGVPNADLITRASGSGGELVLTFGTGSAGTWLCEAQVVEAFGFTANMAAGLAFYDSATGNNSLTEMAHATNISPTDVSLAQQDNMCSVAKPLFVEISDNDTFDLWMQYANIVDAQQNSPTNGSSSGSDLSWTLQVKFTRWG